MGCSWVSALLWAPMGCRWISPLTLMFLLPWERRNIRGEISPQGLQGCCCHTLAPLSQLLFCSRFFPSQVHNPRGSMGAADGPSLGQQRVCPSWSRLVLAQLNVGEAFGISAQKSVTLVAPHFQNLATQRWYR